MVLRNQDWQKADELQSWRWSEAVGTQQGRELWHPKERGGPGGVWRVGGGEWIQRRIFTDLSDTARRLGVWGGPSPKFTSLGSGTAEI